MNRRVLAAGISTGRIAAHLHTTSSGDPRDNREASHIHTTTVPPWATQASTRGARLFATVLRAIQGLQLWASRLTPPPFRLVQIGSAYWQSRSLGVATELDVASQLGDDTLAIGVLAQRCNVVPDGLQRVLRLLLVAWDGLSARQRGNDGLPQRRRREARLCQPHGPFRRR